MARKVLVNPYALANALATLYRPTASVLDSRAPAGSMTPDRQPAQAGPVLVTLTGTPTGTVTIAGTVSGVADTEALSWAGAAGGRTTVKSFSAISGITSSLSGATAIQANATGRGGAPLAATLRTLATGIPVGIKRKNQSSWSGAPAGHEKRSDAACVWPYEEGYTIQPGDLVEADGATYEVTRAEKRGGGLKPTTWALELQERAGRV